MSNHHLDRLLMKGLQYYGYHGVFHAEKELGQAFEVDLVMHVNLKPAGTADDIHKTVHYADVFLGVGKIVQEENFHLLEALAERIAKYVLTEYTMVEIIDVRVKKPHAPIPGRFDYVAVEISRSKGDL